MDAWVAHLFLSDISHGVAFFALFGLVSTLLSLPESLYSTFVLEERFGFNKTTPKIFVLDLLKGLAVGAVIGLPLLAALLWTHAGVGGALVDLRLGAFDPFSTRYSLGLSAPDCPSL